MPLLPPKVTVTANAKEKWRENSSPVDNDKTSLIALRRTHTASASAGVFRCTALEQVQVHLLCPMQVCTCMCAWVYVNVHHILPIVPPLWLKSQVGGSPGQWEKCITLPSPPPHYSIALGGWCLFWVLLLFWIKIYRPPAVWQMRKSRLAWMRHLLLLIGKHSRWFVLHLPHCLPLYTTHGGVGWKDRKTEGMWI